VSAKEYLYGRKRRPSKGQDGTRAALYLRVSTADQKPDLQYDGLRAYAAHAGLDVVRDYCDVGVSGRREGRPQLNALMAAARNRDIDCVLVWKFDRFARSTRHLLAALEEFNHLGVRFVSVQDQVDTDSPMGRAMFTIIGAMAELESSLISERVTAGMRAADTRGKHLGRPVTQQRIVREIETLATSTNLSIRQIQSKIAGRASRGLVGEITKRARDQLTPVALPTSLEQTTRHEQPDESAATER
jgi:DNA invertase Pin-like site-specific DNA recombinase